MYALLGDDVRASEYLALASQSYENSGRCARLLNGEENLTQGHHDWTTEDDSDLLDFAGVAMRRLGLMDEALTVWSRSTELGDAVAPLLAIHSAQLG